MLATWLLYCLRLFVLLLPIIYTFPQVNKVQKNQCQMSSEETGFN